MQLLIQIRNTFVRSVAVITYYFLRNGYLVQEERVLLRILYLKCKGSPIKESYFYGIHSLFISSYLLSICNLKDTLLLSWH